MAEPDAAAHESGQPSPSRESRQADVGLVTRPHLVSHPPVGGLGLVPVEPLRSGLATAEHEVEVAVSIDPERGEPVVAFPAIVLGERPVDVVVAEAGHRLGVGPNRGEEKRCEEKAEQGPHGRAAV
jgi:hypothetical protein